MALTESILDILRELLPAQRPIALHEPAFTEAEKRLVDDCLDSGWVSSVGKYVDRFEEQLSEYTEIPHTIATVNGTAALHTCLILAGVQPGDEVLMPALTFIGSANPVAYQGAIPHFVDCETETLGVDPQGLNDYLAEISEQRDDTCFNKTTGRPIRALMVVHVLGHPARMAELAEIAARYRLVLIEDAAESLGSWRDGQHTGSWGQLSALSFNGNKIITSGGGGAILTRDPELAQRARHLTTTAKQPHPWAFEHDAIAYNYRLPNINAALGCAQLEQLPQRLTQKRRLADHYREAFAPLNDVQLQVAPEVCHSNHWLNLLLLPNREERDRLLDAAHAEKILLRPFWTPLHQQPMFADAPRMSLANSEDLFARGVCLPSSAQLAGGQA
ncbi:MAG TPA: LegC family aminotransferase [Gammaproteobacteria bacterium]|nr:LegC family aminotransferase [Gammaproteobacteria bacterium]